MKLTINLMQLDNDGCDLLTVNNHVKTYLCKNYGGYTAVTCEGGWVSDNGTLYKDKGELVTVYVTGKTDRTEAVNKMKHIARLYQIKAHQESVLITINDKALFIQQLTKGDKIMKLLDIVNKTQLQAQMVWLSQDYNPGELDLFRGAYNWFDNHGAILNGNQCTLLKDELKHLTYTHVFIDDNKRKYLYLVYKNANSGNTKKFIPLFENVVIETVKHYQRVNNTGTNINVLIGAYGKKDVYGQAIYNPLINNATILINASEFVYLYKTNPEYAMMKIRNTIFHELKHVSQFLFNQYEDTIGQIGTKVVNLKSLFYEKDNELELNQIENLARIFSYEEYYLSKSELDARLFAGLFYPDPREPVYSVITNF